MTTGENHSTGIGTSRRSRRCRLVALLAPLLAAAPAGADDEFADRFVLIHDDLQTRTIRLVELDHRRLVHLHPQEGWRTIELESCIAFFDPDAKPAPGGSGRLELADGQRLPGQAISNADPAEDMLAWNHPWLGRLNVPLAWVKAVRFTEDAPTITPGEAEVVLLANGDRREGLIVALGDPIELEVETESGFEVVQIPLERVVSVAMVTPDQPPRGRRVWFRDGTVVDVKSIRVGDDGFVRLSSTWPGQPDRMRIEQVTAVLFNPQGMVPLASLAPSRVEGPSTRYVVPSPQVVLREAPLGLSRIAFRGPLRVRYAVPQGLRRFAAEARLPARAQRWGDYEFLVKDDDLVIFRCHLNADTPRVSIHVLLQGAELTLELTEGRYGPIQDELILEHAMLSR